MKITSSFEMQQWDEKTYHTISDSSRLTRASSIFMFNDEIEGEAKIEWLMYYPKFDANDSRRSTAEYIGLIYFEGSLNGRKGSFVIEDEGVYRGGVAKSQLRVIPESGTGELKGISGEGTYTANREETRFELEYVGLSDERDEDWLFGTRSA